MVQVDSAFYYHQAGLDIRKDNYEQPHYLVGASFGHIGSVHLKAGKFDDAINAFNKALEIENTSLSDAHPLISTRHNDLAEAYLMKGDYEQSLSHVKSSLTILLPSFLNTNVNIDSLINDASPSRELIRSFVLYAKTLSEASPKGERELKHALRSAQAAIRLIDFIRHSYRAEGSKALLGEKTIEIYELAIECAMSLSDITGDRNYLHTAFAISEKSKARILINSFLESNARNVASIPDSLLDREQRLRSILSNLETNIAREQARVASIDSIKVDAWRSLLFDYKQEYRQLINAFEVSYKDYFELKYSTLDVSLEVVQSELLDNRTAILEYFIGKRNLYIFAITKDSLRVEYVPDAGKLITQFQQLRTAIEDRTYHTYRPLAYSIYEVLVGSVYPSIKDAEHLYIIPDGSLNHFPFEALLTEQAQQNELPNYQALPYFLLKHSINYGYSAIAMIQNTRREREETTNDLLALAPLYAKSLVLDDTQIVDTTISTTQNLAKISLDPLPGTKEEIIALKNKFTKQYSLVDRIFTTRSRIFTGRNAKEELFREMDLGSYAYIHIATHGFTNNENPALSRLLFYPSNSSQYNGIDGSLFLNEIYNLKLNAKVVVLSACDSGVGRFIKGEGIIGLTRGFLFAGAQSVTVSLWRVNDERTKELMLRYYDYMLDGFTNAEALRLAKLAVISTSVDHAMPYYWASFISVG